MMTPSDRPGYDEGARLRGLLGHLVTAVVTIALIAAWFGARGVANRRPQPVENPPMPTVAARPEPRPAEPYKPEPVAPPSIPEDILKRVDADEQINIRVYAAVNRGVVNITTSHESGLFGDETTTGSGSGFVIDTQGHILTNYHVVEEDESPHVTFFDGSTHDARVVGLDPSNDVAVLRVAAPKGMLVPLAFGDSSKLAVGMKVLAVGNPFGLERTLTTGIISSLDRSMKAKNGRTIRGIIQTDAAINPGNSGGPLLNSRGEIIGMNTAIISQVGQSAGIGFAVPINAIQRILKPLIEYGHVVRADLGLKRVFVVPDQGLLIVELVEGGPAERAGLEPIPVHVVREGPFLRRRADPEAADIIVAINGKAVRSLDDLLNEVESHAPGEQVTLSVVRGGKGRKVKVTLGKS
jgi:S1-C subfamily serine protease